MITLKAIRTSRLGVQPRELRDVTYPRIAPPWRFSNARSWGCPVAGSTWRDSPRLNIPSPKPSSIYFEPGSTRRNWRRPLDAARMDGLGGYRRRLENGNEVIDFAAGDSTEGRCSPARQVPKTEWSRPLQAAKITVHISRLRLRGAQNLPGGRSRLLASRFYPF